MNNLKIQERIEKLLSLHNHKNTSKEEAEAAILKARELMLKHNLEMFNFDGDNSKSKFKITEHYRPSLKTLNRQSKMILVTLDPYFNVTVFRHKERTNDNTKHSLLLIGLKEDIESFLSIYDYTVAFYNICLQQYLKENKFPSRRLTEIHKNSFLLGFTNGLKAKFEEQNKKYNLVVLDTEINSYIQTQFYGKLKNGSKQKLTITEDDKPYLEGFAKGKNSNPNSIGRGNFCGL